MEKLLIKEFSDRTQLVSAATAWLIDWIEKNTKPDAVLAVAGGSTPQPIYCELAQHNLPWHQIKFMPTDERCVPVSDPRSNEHMLKQCLGEKAQIIRLEANTQALVADAMLLGMGDDGHIASIFADTKDDPQQSSDAIVEVNSKFAPEPRVSLPLSVLAKIDHSLLVITGVNKMQRLHDQAGCAIENFLSLRQNALSVYYAK